VSHLSLTDRGVVAKAVDTGMAVRAATMVAAVMVRRMIVSLGGVVAGGRRAAPPLPDGTHVQTLADDALLRFGMAR
jgi:hypothetical protein